MQGLWQITVMTDDAPVALEAGIETRLDISTISISKNSERFMLQAWSEEMPDEAVLSSIIRQIYSTAEIVEYEITYLAPRDWIAENRKSFPPQHIDRFWVYGSHIDAKMPVSSYPLKIDAAQAFGSGTHPTTQGCMYLLGRLRRLRRTPRTVLDMGCGSAILAMAAKRQFPAARIVAADSDPLSVTASAQNARMNKFARNGFDVVKSAGFGHPLCRTSAPYDLIFANILAPPLRRMACDLTSYLSPSGTLILSGLLDWQADDIISRYRHFGMRLTEQYIIGGWSALMLNKRRLG